MVDLPGAMMYCNFILTYFDLWLFISCFFLNACSKTFLNVGHFPKKKLHFQKPLPSKFQSWKRKKVKGWWRGKHEEFTHFFPRAFSEDLTLYCYARWLKLNSDITLFLFLRFFFLRHKFRVEV